MILTLFICLFFVLNLKAQPQVNGEILYDTNNVQVLKVWGTHYERGFAHGYLLSEEIGVTLVDFFIPFLGEFYQTARQLVSEGGNLVIDSLYQLEAKGMIDGMGAAGFDTTNIDYIDLLACAAWSDFEGFGFWVSPAGPGCSTFSNWGDATEGTDLDGKAVTARMYDWSPIPEVVDNSMMIIHIPSEENLQPWVLVGYAGEMVPSGGGLNESGISCFKNAMSDYPPNMADWEKSYEPYQFAMRKALEYKDFSQDGKNDTYDVRDALLSNNQGYATGHIIPIGARYDAESDARTAMVAEIAPTWPTHVFRTNSYNDTIPGDNLYAANSQIIRNNWRSYCWRYMNVATHMGNGTGIGAMDNWMIMRNYSAHTGSNLGFLQHIPELHILNLSVYRDGMNAWELPYTTFNLREFYNDPPAFITSPELQAEISVEYIYEIETTDIDPYDSLTIIAEQIPDWLTLTDHGDGTALLSGTPDETGMDLVKLKLSDGMEYKYQQFVITVHLPTGVVEKGGNEPKIYPNPFTSKLFIKAAKDAKLGVFSLCGELLLEYRLRDNDGEIDMSRLPSGIYFLRLQTGSEVMTKKVVKL